MSAIGLWPYVAGMTEKSIGAWNGAAVRKWLEGRVVAARADQAVAERAGYRFQDDCDKATAEEMVCALLKDRESTNDQRAFADELSALLEQEAYSGRGVYDDARFDRHVRTYVRKVAKMAKANDGFDRLGRYR